MAKPSQCIKHTFLIIMIQVIKVAKTSQKLIQGYLKYNKESIFWYLFSLLKYVCRSYKSFFLRTEPFQILMLDPNFLCSNRLNQVVPDIIIQSGNDFFKFPGYPLIRPCPQQTILCKMRVGITLVNKMCNLHQFKL